ncbi:hypothetical protein [Clostridium sp. JS66]|uniref:hypothetical protein n=1 Tax=Clostridium sp. JS66 TaxID=3064705 RepID=UPI00298D7C3D|nr:hypothetical protein [Clostridium sp. JS66]WPC41631.1 hypothetical protein Q6H37_27825 [Clostridium sp. JS66]
MDLKNKKKIEGIGSITGFISIWMFYTMRHASPHAKVTTGVVLTIIILLIFICSICTKGSRNFSGAMFVLLLMGIVGTLSNYLDLKNVDHKFLLIIIAILFIAAPVMSYRAAVRSGDVELMRKSKRAIIGVPICIVLMIIIIILGTVGKVFN